MVYNSNNKLPIKENNSNYIFLAGSMDLNSSMNWRKLVIDELGSNNSLLDPTHKNHNNLNEIDMKAHINWELDALSMSDKILLHFLPNALSPISLVELGLYAITRKMIVVCPKAFYKSNYVYTLCEKYSVPVYLKIEDAITQLKN